MKTLILLRHAQAAPQGSGKDAMRPLTKAGRGMAVWVAGELARKKTLPDFVLCSAALRTKETCQHVQDIWAPDHTPQVFFDPAIYTADAHECLAMIHDQDDMHDTLMIIGHNPTMHQLALLLCHAETSSKKLLKMAQNFPPASCAVIELPHEEWNATRKGKGALIDFFHPKDSE